MENQANLLDVEAMDVIKEYQAELSALKHREIVMKLQVKKLTKYAEGLQEELEEMKTIKMREDAEKEQALLDAQNAEVEVVEAELVPTKK